MNNRDKTEILVGELFAMTREEVEATLNRLYSKAGQPYVSFVMAMYDLYHEINQDKNNALRRSE
jgi:hypothetical protein